MYFASRLALGMEISFILKVQVEPEQVLEEMEAAADGGASVLLSVLAVKQQQESIKGVIP